jgi:glyoxylase-like metal-dependent hydrolase (beta-lactamase superfamily II)
MQIYTIDTGLFKLDGGAMFGVVPKSIWQKLNPADENNLCSWAMRCLLIENGKQLILIDTGCGNKQDDKFFSYYYLHGEGSLISSIEKAGFSADDVTDVVLTHLHFDHVGGAISCNADKTNYFPTFKNARYWTNKQHWDWAINPNPREKASFLKENLQPLHEQLSFISSSENGQSYSSGWGAMDFIFVNGHTEAMMLPKITYKNQTFLYAADLVPSAGHIPVPYVMGYDVRPLLTMDEKTQILQQALDNNWILIFEHDPVTECATLTQTDRGIRIGEKGKLKDFLG